MVNSLSIKYILDTSTTIRIMKKQKGVWLDIRNAHIVTVSEKDTQMKTLISGIEEFNPKGGSGTSTPYGAQDSISESSYLKRKKLQTRKFFEAILSEIKDAEAIVLMGPAKMRIALQQFLESNPMFKGELLGNVSADSMTDNQIKAAIKEYFTKHEKHI